LREHPDVWHAWVPPDVVQRVNAALNIQPMGDTAASTPDGVQTTAVADTAGIFPDWSIAPFVNRQLMDVVKRYGEVFRQASNFMLTNLLLPVERLMQVIPPWVFLLLVAALSWHATRKPVATV